MILSGLLDDAYITILNSPLNCCFPTQQQPPPIRQIERPMRIEHHQPHLISSPIFPEPQERPLTRGQEWVDRTRSFASRASSRGSFSVRRKLNAYNGPRRPRIGNPTEFRHVEQAVPQRVIGGFRPLELSIYMPENRLSPILPHLGNIDDISFPHDNASDLTYPATALTHRSDSAMSYSIPRKPLRSNSRASSEWTGQFKPRADLLTAQELVTTLDKELPKPPPVARLRSFTEPPAYERVKSALHERYELELQLKEIDEIIQERQSMYLNSRPTSRLSRPQSIYSEANEPMPTPPTLVPSAPVPAAPTVPSITTRAALPFVDQRPRTAPSKTVHIPSRLKSFTEASAAFTTPSPSSTSSRPSFRPDRSEASFQSPPPLPLVLQTAPPLRKKKSFSRVSSWLFPSSTTEHTRNISLSSITNTPKPITSREGFYQCVDFQPSLRHSTDSILSTVPTLQSTLNEPAMANTWTPGSSPRSDMQTRDVEIRTFSMDSERNERSLDLSRVRTFGEKEINDGGNSGVDPIPGRLSVGVAF